MANFDELVERLTVPLRIDPELRMDVAHELRSHLEDTAEEFRKAGYAEAALHVQVLVAVARGGGIYCPAVS